MSIPDTSPDYFGPHAGGDSIYAAANPKVISRRSTRPPGAGAPFNGTFDEGAEDNSMSQYRPVDSVYSPSQGPSIYVPGKPQGHSPSDMQFQTPSTVLTAPDGSHCRFMISLWINAYVQAQSTSTVKANAFPPSRPDHLHPRVIISRNAITLPPPTRPHPQHLISEPLPPSLQVSTVATLLVTVPINHPRRSVTFPIPIHQCTQRRQARTDPAPVVEHHVVLASLNA